MDREAQWTWIRRPARAFRARLVKHALAGALTSLTFLTSGSACSDAHAEPARIRLRGSAHIDAHGARAAGDELSIQGALLDDAGAPLAHESVLVTIARAASPGDPIALGDDRKPPRACSANDRAPHLRTGGVVAIATDAAGRFCVRVPLPIDRYVAHVAWGGSPLVDGASIDVPVDLSRRALVLRFDPSPHVVALDRAPFAVDAVAEIDDGGTRVAGAHLALTVSNERGTAIGSLVTQANGRARLTVDPALTGPPGRGELRLGFAGDAATASASQSVEIERHARVELTVANAKNDVLPPATPEDGVPLDVRVHAARSDVDGGSIEARAFGVRVGAAPVEHGAASLVLTFATGNAGASAAEVPITLRYVPSAPWFEPAADAVIRLPVRSPSPWRQTPLVAAGLAVIAWFVLGRTARARDVARARAPRPKPVSKGEPKVDVLEVARDPDAGWTGRVVDAHDGSPIGKARVAIERPAFRAAEALASTVTGDDGRFELRTAAAERRAGDELVVDAALHASLRQSLPPSGALAIALVSRKRALLGRLVAWARQQGRPFDAKPEPTPAHVRRHAGKDFTLARWADAVERAAFAGGMVDGNVEAEIDRLAPPPLPAAPASPLAPPPSPSGEVADPPSEGRARAHAVPAPADARRDPPPRDAPPRSRT